MTLLENKLVLVTGGGGGLGAAMAHGVVKAGARVIVADVRLEAAEAVAGAIRARGGQAWAEAVDVTDRAATQRLADALGARLGPIDVLVNNAGISGKARIDDPNAAEVWDRLIQVNLQGLFNVTHAFVPALKQSRGCIVNLSSIVAFVSGISSAGYIASKGAVRSFTQALARDLAPFGVRANAVAPGLMLTDMVKPQLQVQGGTDWYMDRVPMKRGGEPEEIVGPVVFLASGMASYVNGVVLPVDGGFLSA
ncbi:SDR family NAD(P)-dependent oxidoreductase [Variovorax sp. JS1663]|uniref:SDR family NAD(P)-dependent oxidoreductase n=1 Tax=Variovorax sp. JS1663 TaxID=1851577 RepID=UPI000B348144|nr:SDR family NAD(P)-dependent oxidoreductase [Variovorax sp. JS1663]OUL99660.1 3-oxoacyl-ACP reductase [Variovorax sp. JS1663]